MISLHILLPAPKFSHKLTFIYGNLIDIYLKFTSHLTSVATLHEKRKKILLP